MATRGNQTCVQLQNVAKTGFASSSTSLIIKGTWFPEHFVLAITDGDNAWQIEATEAIVRQNAIGMKVTTSQYVDMVQLHLGQQQATSLYSLHSSGSKTVQLMCTPRDDQDLNMEFTLELTLRMVSALYTTYDMLQFLMRAYIGLTEESERKSRAFERAKATTESSITELQSQKAQLETELRRLQNPGMKTAEDKTTLLNVPCSSAGKRKSDSSAEGTSVKKRPQRKGPPTSTPLPPPASRPHLSASVIRESSRLRISAVSLLTGPEKKVENGGSPEEEQSACDGGWEAGDRSNENLLGKFNIDGSLETCRNSPPKSGFPEDHVQIGGKKRGRKPKVSAVQADLLKPRFPEDLVQIGIRKRGRPRKVVVQVEATGGKLPAIRACGGGQRDSVTEGEMTSEHRIEEQAERAIKLLEPFTKLVAIPATRQVGRPVSSGRPTAEKASARKSGSSQVCKSNAKGPHVRDLSEEETSPSLALTADNGAANAVPLKEFDVINADFHDFDSDRSKHALAMGQYWALYDNQDGMPRFYGRICSFSLEPFVVEVEWLEPHCPKLRASGLVKTAGLSAGCGEFKVGTVSDQPLAAFSHRIEVQTDARKGIFRLHPRKGEVWALFKGWDKAKPKQVETDAEVKYDYELVEVQTGYSKEKGVKVGPIVKVPGFKTMFKSGVPMLANWILPKDVQSRFSHRIPTHHFDGSQMQPVPRGSFGLDSASTPEEYMLSGRGYKIDTPVHAVKVLQTVSESG